MKGLIIKDLCVLKNQMKTLLLVLAFFIIFSIINEDATFILFLVPFYMIMILITTFNYDEFNKWDSYCNSLPLSRKEIVKSKYILFNATSLIVLIVGILSSLIIPNFIKNTTFESLFASIIGVAFGICLVISLLIPFYYKFGANKGRIMLFLCIVILALIIGMITSLDIFNNKEILNLLNSLNNLSLGMITLLLIILTSIVMSISYYISVRIYKNKEL